MPRQLKYGFLGATANPIKSDKKMRKGATGQSFIRKEVTSYKIHTLVKFLEPVCCKKRPKKSKQETGLRQMGHLKVLNDTKLVLNGA